MRSRMVFESPEGSFIADRVVRTMDVCGRFKADTIAGWGALIRQFDRVDAMAVRTVLEGVSLDFDGAMRCVERRAALVGLIASAGDPEPATSVTMRESAIHDAFLQGRFAMYDPGSSLGDASLWSLTSGFFDDNDTPPTICWIAHATIKRSELLRRWTVATGFLSEGIVCWIPNAVAALLDGDREWVEFTGSISMMPDLKNLQSLMKTVRLRMGTKEITLG